MEIVDLFILCLLIWLVVVISKAVNRSKWFNRFCDSMATQSDDAVVSLDEAERNAKERAEEDERIASLRSQNAKQIRNRLGAKQ